MGPREFESTPRFVIEEMTVADVDLATEMRKQSWIDTYENSDLEVTKEWIEEYFSDKLLPENSQKRRKRFEDAKDAGTFNAWVARNDAGDIIGSSSQYVTTEGVQMLGSMYVDKKWHGTGVGAQLMQKVIDWFDSSAPIKLGVVSYNERAKAFYKKWGFEEVPKSEAMFADKIPELQMVRPPQTQENK